MTQENEAINKLQNDLHILHFHELGAGQLAEKLIEIGYRLVIPSKLTVLSDEEIITAIESDPKRTCGWTTYISPRDRLLVRTQRDFNLKQLGVEEK